MSHDWKNNANQSERLGVRMALALMTAGGFMALATAIVDLVTGERQLAALGASIALFGMGMAQGALVLAVFFGRRTNERLQVLEDA